jgi:hypothetical protein
MEKGARACSSRSRREVRERQQDGNDAASMASRYVDNAGAHGDYVHRIDHEQDLLRGHRERRECQSPFDWS